MKVELTEEQRKLILDALEAVQVQGSETMRRVLAIIEKLSEPEGE